MKRPEATGPSQIEPIGARPGANRVIANQPGGNALATAWAAAATLAAPALRLMLLIRRRRGKELAGRLAERRGIQAAARPTGRLLWLHAASVGETASLLPVLPVLLADAPDLTILLTTGTVTAAALLAQRLDPDIAPRVLHRFVPLDVPAWVARFLEHWRPDAAGFVESELWPNLLAGCHARGIPVALVNARMSARSLARWRRVPGLARRMLGGFAAVQARSEGDAAGLRQLGVARIDDIGDLKAAAPPLPADPAELARLRAALAGQPVWLAASTHPGEEALVFDAHRRLAPDHPGILTIIVPRHPQRGAAIAASAPDLATARRVLGEPPPATGVWIADTLDELGLWYRLAGIAFIGRSLLPPGGGQNPLEPARLGCAIAVGPHVANFAAHVAALRAAGGLDVVEDAAALAGWVDALLRDPARRASMAAAAEGALRHDADLPARVAAMLLALLPAGQG